MGSASGNALGLTSSVCEWGVGIRVNNMRGFVLVELSEKYAIRAYHFTAVLLLSCPEMRIL